MSATVLLVPNKAGKIAITKWHKMLRLGELGHTIIPPRSIELETVLPEISWARGCYPEFNRTAYTFDYAIWDRTGGDFAWVVGQEMIKRKWIRRAGWDSVGYCKKLGEFCKGQVMSISFDMAKRYIDDAKKTDKQLMAQYLPRYSQMFKDKAEAEKGVREAIADIRKEAFQADQRKIIDIAKTVRKAFRTAAKRLVDAKSFDEVKDLLLGEGSPANMERLEAYNKASEADYQKRKKYDRQNKKEAARESR
jgi:hypothetical protein